MAEIGKVVTDGYSPYVVKPIVTSIKLSKGDISKLKDPSSIKSFLKHEILRELGNGIENVIKISKTYSISSQEYIFTATLMALSKEDEDGTD